MASSISTTSFARFASGATLATVLFLGAVSLRDQHADACGWSGPTGIEEVTTFDPDVADDPAPAGLQFDPYHAGFGGACEDCARTAMLADWDGYLAGAIPRADWEKLLLQTSTPDLMALSKRVGAKAGPPIDGVDPSRWSAGGKARAAKALGYATLARRVEALSADEAAGASPAEIKKLLAEARAGLKTAREAFLTQRYAFQIVRIQFYQRDYAGLVAFFDKSSAQLERPSADLAWRARYYVAGALRKHGNLARANLELSRIHTGSEALAGAAAQDFQPMEDSDWREALRQARTPREQAQLWRLVGLQQDGLVAAQEIAKLDPRSDLIGLLIVRELAKAEASGASIWDDGPDPSVRTAPSKGYAALEELARKLAATPGADRPWLMKLVAGHLAARRGDVAAARTLLTAAVAARPGEVRVASQAKASLALALAAGGKPDPAREDELAKTMNGLDPGFARLGPVTAEVRGTLAVAYAKAGRTVDAEFLRPGIVDPIDPKTGKPPATSRWSDVRFLRDMIARAGKNTSAFDKFVLGGSFSKPELERELALQQLLDGDFAGASKTFATTKATSTPLGTDPFVMHIVDCHDCDHAAYASAPWTHASMTAKMAELSKTAAGKGDAAAQAALSLGVAFYNLTWYGNARVVLESTHHATRETQAAARWFKHAFEVAGSRELKARAAFYASKAEMMGIVTAKFEVYDEPEVMPVPTTWYPIVKSFDDTRYYKEILAECGSFRRWAAARPIKTK